MKKTLTLFALFLSFLTISFAQTPKITWGPEVEGDNFIGRIFLENENGIHSLAIKKEQFFLQLFDSNTMVKKKSSEIILPKIKGIESEFEHVFSIGGNIVVFASALDKQNDQFYLVAYNVSPMLVMDKTPVEIFNIPVENKNRAGDFGFICSQDSNMLMVYNTRKDKKTKTQTSSIKVLHPGLGTVAEVTETFPLKSDDYKVACKSFLLDSEGNICMVISQTDYSGSLIKDREFFLYFYDRNNDMKKTVTKLDAEDAKIAEIMVKPASNGDLIATGFFSLRNNGIVGYEGIAGSFYMSLNPATGEIKKRVFNNFDVPFQAELLGSRKAEKGKLIPNYYIPRQLEILNDNSAVMIAEYYYVYSAVQNGMRITNYYYNDIIVAKFGIDGKLQWAKHIIKEQVWSKTELAVAAYAAGPAVFFGAAFWINLSKDQTIYYSYLLGKKDNTLSFVYNDHPDNVELTDPKGTKTLLTGKKGVPVLVKITPDGKMTKTSMFTSDDDEVVFRPGISLQTSGSRIIVYGSRKDIDKLGVLTF